MSYSTKCESRLRGVCYSCLSFLRPRCLVRVFATDIRQLAGTWLAESNSPQGMIPQLIELTPSEHGLTGNWQSVAQWPWRYSGMIKEVSIDHDSLSFKVFYGTYPGMVWKGHWRDDNHFVMTLMSNEGLPIKTREFRRVSTSGLDQARAQAPRDFITHKLPLPELRDLPSNGLALRPPWVGTAGIRLGKRSTIRRCEKPRTRWCPVDCAVLDTSTSPSTMDGKDRGTPGESSIPIQSFRIC